MTRELFFKEFSRVAEAPGAVDQFRKLVRALGLNGLLTDQLPTDGSAAVLFDEAQSWKPIESADPNDGLELPYNWMQVPLGALGSWAHGCGFPKSEQGQSDGKYPFLKVSDMNLVGNERSFKVANNYIDDAAVHRLHANIYPAGTIVFPKIGGAIATNKRRMLSVPSTFDNNCLGMTFLESLSLEWCYLLLTSMDFAAYQVGTAVPALQQRTLGSILVNLPPRSEQERIVTKVEELLSLCDRMEIAQNERESQRNQLRSVSLHRMRSTERDPNSAAADIRYFLDISERLITKSEHVTAVRELVRDLAVQGKLAPRELRRCVRTSLGEIGTWGSGGTPNTGNREYYGGGIPWVVIGDLNEGTVFDTAQTITEIGLANSSAKMIDAGVVLVAMYGASVGKLGITGVRCSTNQAIAHCIPNADLIDRDFLFLLLRSLRGALVASAKGGAQPNISQTVLKGWTFVLPPLAEQRHIVTLVEALLGVCDELESALAATEAERVRLLDALLNEAVCESGEEIATSEKSVLQVLGV